VNGEEKSVSPRGREEAVEIGEEKSVSPRGREEAVEIARLRAECTV
jgi:hypothetical protein